MSLLAVTLYHTDPNTGRVMLHAMPVMLARARAASPSPTATTPRSSPPRSRRSTTRRVTPAHRFNDGQNYHPTNKWVLFGHHFAAISGAGPLIGPVLAIQYGYMPGLLWLVIGVCLAGAVQDMLVLAASVRRDGKSLAEIARAELGRPPAIIASLAILFIVIIALAGLGFVVVKALGGEEVKLPAGMTDHAARTSGRRRSSATSSDRAASCTTSRRVRGPLRRGPAGDRCGRRRSASAVPQRPAGSTGRQRGPLPTESGRDSDDRAATRPTYVFPPAARRSSPAARGARSPSPARSRSRCSSACGCTASARAASSRRRSSAAC